MATRTIWRDCAHCFRPFEQPNDPGRKRVFCSDACKQAAYRRRKRRAEQAEQQRQRRFYEQAREHARRQHEREEHAHRERARQHASTEPPGDTGRPRFHCAGCGGRRAAHTFHHDQPAHSRARRRWDALLRKAASTTFPEEAAACRAKAEQLAAKYGL
jgi:hypothetical protein